MVSGESEIHTEFNANVFPAGWKPAACDRTPQSWPDTAHPAHLKLHGSFHPDCCSKTKKSTVAHSQCPQNQNASAHAPRNRFSHGCAPRLACSSSEFRASHRFQPLVAMQNMSQTKAAPARTVTGQRRPWV